MSQLELQELLETIATETGFVNYESNAMAINKQMVFYGHSSMFEDFKELAGDAFMTGTLVYFVDTRENKMYCSWDQTWY